MRIWLRVRALRFVICFSNVVNTLVFNKRSEIAIFFPLFGKRPDYLCVVKGNIPLAITCFRVESEVNAVYVFETPPIRKSSSLVAKAVFEVEELFEHIRPRTLFEDSVQFRVRNAVRNIVTLVKGGSYNAHKSSERIAQSVQVSIPMMEIEFGEFAVDIDAD